MADGAPSDPSAAPLRSGPFHAADVFAVLFLALAALPAWIVTRDLVWPAEIDVFRDLAGARHLLAGHYPGDPAYAGQTVWYPPGVPALFAGLHLLTGVPLEELFARAGTWVNLLGPAAFYLWARRVLGAWPALGALVAFLFLRDPGALPWFSASYAPWPWPFQVAFGPAFLSLIALDVAERSARPAWSVAAGALMGLTFLVHPAPGILLAVTAVLCCVVRVWRAATAPERRSAWARLLSIGVPAALVASVFLVPWFVGSGYARANPAPATWVGMRLSDVLHAHLSWRAAAAALGGWVAWRRWRGSGEGGDPRTARVTRCVAGAVALLFGWGLFTQVAARAGVILPVPVPTYHFHLYVSALEALLAGVGLHAAASAAGRAAARRAPSLATLRTDATPLLLTLLVAVLLPREAAAPRLRDFQARALSFGSDEAAVGLHRWVQDHGGASQVWLAEPREALRSIVAAGAHAFLVPATHAHPAVDHARRRREFERMMQDLERGAWEDFRQAADRHGITHVVHRGILRDAPEWMQPVWERPGVRVWALSPAP